MILDRKHNKKKWSRRRWFLTKERRSYDRLLLLFIDKKENKKNELISLFIYSILLYKVFSHPQSLNIIII
jgi:hypothetical protein